MAQVRSSPRPPSRLRRVSAGALPRGCATRAEHFICSCVLPGSLSGATGRRRLQADVRPLQAEEPECEPCLQFRGEWPREALVVLRNASTCLEPAHLHGRVPLANEPGALMFHRGAVLAVHASTRPAMISSRSCSFRRRSGRPCVRRTRSSVSTKNSDVERRRRRASRAKTRYCSCSLACCEPDR